MTSTTRFIPLRPATSNIASLQNRLNSMFSELAQTVPERQQSFVPAVDIYEDAQGIKLQLEVPGIKQDDLDIRVEEQTLTVKGERKLATDVKQENFHRIERRFGSFVRTFTLPQTVDTESIAAGYDAGVLTISLSKKAEAKPRQVKIEINAAPAGETAQTSAPTEVSPAVSQH